MVTTKGDFSYMQTLSYSDYDALIDTFSGYGTPTFIPTPEQVDILASDPSKYLRFGLYLSEFGPAPSNDDEKYSRQLLTQLLYSHIQLAD